ncbi:MAG: AsmA family protein [Gammaproteobacteria bacterium]
MSLARRIAFIVAAVTVALAGLVAGLALSFDSQRYKDEIARWVRDRTGRSLVIDGRIGFTWSLVPTLAAERVRLSNPPGMAGDLLRVERIEARVALAALLQRHVEVRALKLTGVGLALGVDAHGAPNWRLGTGGGRAGAALPLTLARLELERVRVDYRAAAGPAAQPLVLARLTLVDGPDGAALAFGGRWGEAPLQASGRLAPLAHIARDRATSVAIDGTLQNVAVGLRGQAGASGYRLQIQARAPSAAILGAVAGLNLPVIGPAWVRATLAPAGEAIALTDLAAGISASDLTGTATLARPGGRATVAADLSARVLDLREWTATPLPPRRRGRVFGTDPFPGVGAGGADLDARLKAARFTTHAINVEGLDARIALRAGRLSVDIAEGALAGGRIRGRLDYDATVTPAAIDMTLDAAGVVPSRLPRLANRARLQGAPTDVKLRLRGRGSSLAELMAGANGTLRVEIGPGSMPNNIAGADLLLSMLRLLNPLAARSPATALECAVLDFDIRDGVARAANGIGVRTAELDIIGGGAIDLGTEALAIAARPRPRKGIGLNLASLADVVRLGGTLATPRVAVDAADLARSGLKIGAGVATGGLSLLGEGLFDRSAAAANRNPCEIARDARPARPVDAAGKAQGGAGAPVKGFFKRLFGR